MTLETFFRQHPRAVLGFSGGVDSAYLLYAAAAAGADLILSGHTHGGQIWPAGAAGMVARNERNYGRKQVSDRCTAIVSGGTGTWGYRLRTQGKTEIVCITVEQKA